MGGNMETLSVAVALASGEIATAVISSVDDHPFLDLCGVARSIPDLIRLLDRFHPAVLLIAPSLLEELEQCGPEEGDALKLSMPIAFLLSHPGMSWDEEGLAGLLRLPLRYGGVVCGDPSAGRDLFHEIKRKVDLYRKDDRPGTMPHGSEERGWTRLIAVMGCKGGVGTTLLASSLAASIALAGRRVLLMEMDSDLSQLMYLKPRDEGKVLLDLLPLAEEMSWDLVRLSVYRHAGGFHLLPHGRKPEDGLACEAAAPGQLLRNLLFLFDTVIQDFPFSSRKYLPALLHHHPVVLLVSLPDTMTSSCACGAAAYLHRTGLNQDRLRLVVNRCGSHHVLNPDELARAVGLELFAALPEDPRSGLDFAELGELPHLESPLGRAVVEMAADLGYGDIPSQKTSSQRHFKRMRKRKEHWL
jgi:MinD-like ATPase involved in chromosome partitioning or flagellar assembly